MTTGAGREGWPAPARAASARRASACSSPFAPPPWSRAFASAAANIADNKISCRQALSNGQATAALQAMRADQRRRQQPSLEESQRPVEEFQAPMRERACDGPASQRDRPHAAVQALCNEDDAERSAEVQRSPFLSQRLIEQPREQPDCAERDLARGKIEQPREEPGGSDEAFASGRCGKEVIEGGGGSVAQRDPGAEEGGRIYRLVGAARPRPAPTRSGAGGIATRLKKTRTSRTASARNSCGSPACPPAGGSAVALLSPKDAVARARSLTLTPYQPLLLPWAARY